MGSTDKAWERYGSENPYYGVLGTPRYLGRELGSTEIRNEFYTSGAEDVAWVIDWIRRVWPDKSEFAHAVDFGCGVGRLSFALASVAREVTGLDVSSSVIDVARHNLPQDLSGRVTFAVVDDRLNTLPASYDFVFSYIVLQHIARRRGMRLLHELVHRLDNFGVAAIHVTFERRASWAKKAATAIADRVPLVHRLGNFVRNRPKGTPRMLMTRYRLPEVLATLAAAGIVNTIQLGTDHSGHLGVMVLGRKGDGSFH